MEKEVAKLEENQETHAPNGWGGKRQNAGRKRHSRDKLVVTDFFTPEERDRLVKEAKLLTIDADGKPDKDMIKFLWEQLFGKATQRTELTGEEGKAINIFFDQAFKDYNEASR